MKIVPKLTHPCPQDWNAMTGDSKRRFCSQCQLHVHNLSAMSEREQVDLLANNRSRVCIGYIDDQQTIQVKSRTWLTFKRLGHWTRAAAAILSVSLPALLTQCSTPPPPPPAQTALHDCPPTAEVEASDGGKIIAGGIFYEEPRWKRWLLFWKS